MKEWAKWFYHSRAWRKCRASYLKSKFGICERCGGAAQTIHHKKHLTPENINDPEISLSFDNLEALCKKCHDDHHKWNRKQVESINDGLMFDEEGNVIRV